MKRLSLVAAVLCAAAVSAFPQDAEEIVRASRERIQAATTSSRSRMVITARDGSTTERLVDEYSSDAEDGSRVAIVFQKPASVAGTRFLNLEHRDKPQDRWIFLPSLGKVRRIAASEGAASFMGTDLTYDDISAMDRDVSLDAFSLLREDVLDGRACWVIQAVPKSDSFQYSRMVLWIEKATHIGWKIELYDRKGALVKLIEILETREVQGRVSPVATRVSTVAAKTSTTIYVEILKYDDPIPATVFTTRFLETGRP